MKLIFAITLSAIFFTAPVYAQNKEKKPAPAKPKAASTPSASPSGASGTVNAPKIEPIPDAYTCSVVIIDPVTKETKSISKEGVQGYNQTLASQNCVNELNGKVEIKDGKKYFTVERPEDKVRVEAGAVSVRKIDPSESEKGKLTEDEFMKSISTDEKAAPKAPPPRPKYSNAAHFCSKIANGNVVSTLKLEPANNLEEQLKELKASGFGEVVMSKQGIANSRSIDDRAIPVGAVLVLEKKPNSGSGCPIPDGGKPVVVAKCNATHITWPNGQPKKLDDFLKDHKNCITSIVQNKDYPKVTSGIRVGPPAPAPAESKR